jgi:hypothetical protein
MRRPYVKMEGVGTNLKIYHFYRVACVHARIPISKSTPHRGQSSPCARRVSIGHLSQPYICTMTDMQIDPRMQIVPLVSRFFLCGWVGSVSLTGARSLPALCAITREPELA